MYKYSKLHVNIGYMSIYEIQGIHNTCFWTDDVVVWMVITLGAGGGESFGAGLGGSLGGTSGGGLEWVVCFVSKALIFS